MAKRSYTKKSPYWDNLSKKSQSGDVSKAGNTDQVTSRLKLGEIGTTALSTINIYTSFIKDYEIAWPRCIDTFEEMALDQDVATALRANGLFVERAFDDFEVTFNKDSKQSEDAAKFVKWCLKNMDGQTLKQAIREALTYKVHGFSVLEKVYTKVLSGEYVGKYKVKKLAARPQTTLRKSRPFKYSEDGREVLGVYQNIPNATSFTDGNTVPLVGEIYIPRNKFLLFGEQITDTNPMGKSPLASLYRPWKEKTLIAEYEVVGVAKDMGGMPVLEVPAEIMNKAAEDPNSDEAYSIEVLKSQMANLHAGEQSFMIIPSDVQEQGNGIKQYSIKFLGIEGSGKQFDTQTLKNERKKDIYDGFGAYVLIMGSGDGGSYNLSDNKQNLHSQFVEHDVKGCTDVLNKDFIPQLLALNGMYLSDEDMPVFVPGEVGDPDIEANSKMIQRIIAVGAVPLTPEVMNEFMSMCGIKYQIPDEILLDENKLADFMAKFVPNSTSRSGDGMAQGTNGNGTSTAVAVDDTSSLNTENAS